MIYFDANGPFKSGDTVINLNVARAWRANAHGKLEAAGHPLLNRLAPWLRCVEMARQGSTIIPPAMYEALKGWASVLVGNDAPEQWRVEGGYEALIRHMTEKLDL